MSENDKEDVLKPKKTIKFPKINLSRRKKKIKDKIVIQPIDEYLVENRIPEGKIDISAFPDLFGIRLEKNKRDDIATKNLSLKGSPAINLYASLLVAVREIQEKK
jgi:hypothetical protein